MQKNKITKKIKFLISQFYKKQKINSPLKKNYLNLNEPIIGASEVNNVIKALLNNRLSQGPLTKKFEKLFSKLIGPKYTIAVNSGSSANLISLLAIKKLKGLKDNDEVIIPASTFATVAMPIIQIGLKPVYVDININTLNIDPIEISKAITKKTKVIMPVHTLGLSANMGEILKIAKRKQITVIEDCCESHGATLGNKITGNFGDIATFSFFASHHLTTGEGGLIVTNSKKLAKLCKSFREFGRIDQDNIIDKRFYSDSILKDYDKRYVFEQLGYNMRLSDVAASIGLGQIPRLKKINQLRIQNAKYLYDILVNRFSKYFYFPGITFDGSHVFFGFPFLIKDKAKFSRREICEFLEKNNIETRPMMAGSLPDQPALKNQKKRIIGNLKSTRYVRDNFFFIGIHPKLTKENFDYLFKILDRFFRK